MINPRPTTQSVVQFALLLVVTVVLVYAATSNSAFDPAASIKYSVGAMVALGGLFFITRSPTAALIALVAIVYLNISDILISRHGLPSINKFLVPMMCVLAVYWAYQQERQLRAVPLAIAIALIYFSFVSSSLLYTDYPDLTTATLSKVIKDLVIFVIITALLCNRRDLKLVVWTLVLSAAFLSLLSVINTFTGDVRQDFLGFATWNYVVDDYGQPQGARIGGNVYSPNYFAQLLLLTAPMAVNRGFFEPNRAYRYAAILCALLIMGGVLVTLSRSGLIILVLMIVVNAFVVVKNNAARTAMVVVSIFSVSAAVLLAPDAIAERVSSIFLSIQQILSGGEIEDGAVKGRLHEMLAAVYMFLDHPIIGVGFSTFSGYFQDYALAYDMTVRMGPRDAHNLYLEIAAEGGVVGLLVFFLVIGVALYICVQSIKKARDCGDNELAGLLLSILIGYVAYLAAYMFVHDAYQRYFWLLTGITIATANIQAVRGEDFKRRRQAR